MDKCDECKKYRDAEGHLCPTHLKIQNYAWELGLEILIVQCHEWEREITIEE